MTVYIAVLLQRVEGRDQLISRLGEAYANTANEAARLKTLTNVQKELLNLREPIP